MEDLRHTELCIINRVTGYDKEQRNDIIRNIPPTLFVTPTHRNCYEWILNNLLKGDTTGECA